MEIKKTASAGTLESSDILVTIEQGSGSIALELHSSVEQQFGAQIRKVILETLAAAGVTSAKVSAQDRGALDCTVKARVLAAVHRAAEVDCDWEGKSCL